MCHTGVHHLQEVQMPPSLTALHPGEQDDFRLIGILVVIKYIVNIPQDHQHGQKHCSVTVMQRKS